MKRKSLLLFALVPLILAGCSKEEDKPSGGSTQPVAPTSQTSDSTGGTSAGGSSSSVTNPSSSTDTGTSEIVVAKVALPKLHKPGSAADDFSLDYVYTGLDQTVEVVGMDSSLVEIVDSSKLTGRDAKTYSVEFKLKNTSVSKWEDESITNKVLEWTINKGSMASIDFVAEDFKYDELKPAPMVETGVPEGTTKSYKYYYTSQNKYDYVPGTVNDIVPGSYVLEATYENPNYETVVKTYGFVVSKAEFDDKYALASSTVDVGTMDPFFVEADIDLNSLLSVKVVATEETLSGVTFAFKNTPSKFEDDNPSVEDVVVSKEYYNDAVYSVTFNHTRKRIAKPFLTLDDGVTPYTSAFTYDGTTKEVKLAGFDPEIMGYAVTPVMTGISVATYDVKIKLLDVYHSCWEDGTNGPIDLLWTIDPFYPAGASCGFELFVGTQGSGNSLTIMNMDAIDMMEPLPLEFYFLDQEDHWNKYEDATFVIPESDKDYASIESNVLTLKQAHSFTIEVGTSNMNHTFDQNYDIEVDGSSRVLSYRPGTASACTAAFFGLDTTNFVAGSASLGGYGDTYIVKSTSGGEGFRTDRRFASIDKVLITFDPSSFSSNIELSVLASPEGTYTDTGDNICIDHWIYVPYTEETKIVYDFSGKTFDPAKSYFVTFWMFQGMNITSIDIFYTVD